MQSSRKLDLHLKVAYRQMVRHPDISFRSACAAVASLAVNLNVCQSKSHYISKHLLVSTFFLYHMEPLELQFQNFFNNCKKQGLTADQMNEICRPLVWRQRMWKLKRFLLVVLVLWSLYYVVSTVEWFSWFFSAIGRMLLIQLLPYWNWTPLYNAKCLVERATEPSQSKPTPRLSKYETEEANCVLCEFLDNMPTASNVSFSYIESNFLERGLPIIITDSHVPQHIDDFLDALLLAGFKFLESEPCDLGNNLMLSKFFQIELALEKIRNSATTDKWFLQLRNCQFSAVKASRLFLKRPYYYPVHLEPFYSSWLLMSQNYNSSMREIYLSGLVFMQQISGSFNVKLQPKQPCNAICPVINIRLTAGESLVFATDLWMLSYGATQANIPSIATILEINWQL